MLKRILAAAFLCAIMLAPVGAAERVVSFISDVNVQRNGDLLVIETIQVQAEGRVIRRGILRDFPTTYTRADGSHVEVGFEVQGVARDGAAENFVTERMSNGVRIRIGSADHLISTGLHEYVIKYRTTRQVGFFSNFDELYWNVTGTGWTFPIDVAEARITLPERVEFKQTALYTGPQGARDKDARIVEQAPGRIVFRTTKGLAVNNGLTVAAAWQKGIVAPPTQAQQIESLLHDNPGIQYAAFGSAGIILFYCLAWLLVGRDPRRGTVIPLFAPPEGMSAAAVRFVENMNFDNRVFTAAIVGLGVNGHLKISGSGVAGVISHVKGSKPLDAAEKVVEDEMFAKKSSVHLDQSDHEDLNNAKWKLYRTLTKTYKGKLFANNFIWSFAGLLAVAGVIAAIGHAFLENYGASAPGMLAGMLVPLLPIMAGAGQIRTGKRNGSMLRMLIGLVVIIAAVAIGVVILAANVGLGLAIVPAVVPYVLVMIAALGFGWLQAPSKLGRQTMDQIEGFKQYLSVAEEDRLNFLNPPEKTPELFERFLPYAIALDVQNAWAKRFVGVLATAGAAAAVASWYSGHDVARDPVGFADRIGENLVQTIASASSSPASSGGSDSSSGSSGGGSSGGGGGGGGGSGW
ncbi:MAG: DUF2207 domain-containing protein [Pseudolabrys sp.]